MAIVDAVGLVRQGVSEPPCPVSLGHAGTPKTRGIPTVPNLPHAVLACVATGLHASTGETQTATATDARWRRILQAVRPLGAKTTKGTATGHRRHVLGALTTRRTSIPYAVPFLATRRLQARRGAVGAVAATRVRREARHTSNLWLQGLLP